MDSVKIFELILDIEKGYTPNQTEQEILNSIERLSLKNNEDIDYIPTSINLLANLRELNLKNTNVTFLPCSIGNLAYLEKLNLRNTKISFLPNSIGNLLHLRFLDLWGTCIKSLPDSIGKLKALESFDLGGTEIEILPDSFSMLNRLSFLNLRGSKLSCLPSDINKLMKLEELNIEGTPIKDLPKSIVLLSNLKSLKIGKTNIEVFPNNIGNMESLRVLHMSETKISEIPKEIGGLTKLQSFDLKKSKVNKLPDSISKLCNLELFDLEGTSITVLPNDIGNLKLLKELNLSNTNISMLPKSFSKLENLQYLSITCTPLELLPEDIGELKNLQRVYLWKTLINKLPESLGKLYKLKNLNLRGTKISSIPKSFINLKCLQNLNLRGTQISKLPDIFSSLTELKILDLAELYLFDIPYSIAGLGIPFVFKKSMVTVSEGINLYNTTLLSQPISLFLQSSEFIMKYYDEEKIDICESKIIILGHGGVGKTYTLNRILNEGKRNDYNTKTTYGINIQSHATKINDDLINIRFWDFGGQEIMHSMHRCFLTDRTCYIVVVSSRQCDLTGQAQFWLKNIQSFANKCPVMIMVNLWDDDLIPDIDVKKLKNEFNNLVDIIPCNAKYSSENIFLDFMQKLYDMIKNSNCYKMKFPKAWEKIRQELLCLNNNNINYLSGNDYNDICVRHNLQDDDKNNIKFWLLQLFNDLGVCFSFGLNKRVSSPFPKYSILTPEWLTNALYCIIKEGVFFHENGIINISAIKKLLNECEMRYTDCECDYILNVMREFSMSYFLSDQNKEFIPALCPNEIPDLNLLQSDYRYHYVYLIRYSYLPDNLVHQLMIFCYNNLRLNDCWRKGFVLETIFRWGPCFVIDGSQKDILRFDIYTNNRLGDFVRPFLSIRQQIEIINHNLNINIIDEEIILETTLGIEKFSVRRLLNLKKRKQIIAQGEYIDLEIDDILLPFFGDMIIRGIEKDIECSTKSKKTDDELTVNEILEKYIVNAENIVINHSFQYGECTIPLEEVVDAIISKQNELNDAFLSKFIEILDEKTDSGIKTLLSQLNKSNNIKSGNVTVENIERGINTAGSMVTLVGGAIKVKEILSMILF